MLKTYPVRWHLGTPDSPLCGPHQSDGNPTLDVSAHPSVGFSPLCCEVTGYPLQYIRFFHTQQSINGGNGGGEVCALMEACLQVDYFIFPLCLLQKILQRLRQMGLSICVHDTHVVNTVSPIQTEFTDQEVTLLFCGL